MSAKRSTAAQAVAAGFSYRQAAKQAGIAPRTLRKWRSEPDFAALVDRYAAALEAGFQRRIIRVRTLGMDGLEAVLEGVKHRKGRSLTAAEAAMIRLALATPLSEKTDPFDPAAWEWDPFAGDDGEGAWK